MIWLKSALAGFAAALATVITIVFTTTTWSVSAGEGSGGIAAMSVGLLELLFAALLAFALGFSWMRRRLRRRLFS